MTDCLALIGDPVDNIKGVAGVGKKTAERVVVDLSDKVGLAVSVAHASGASSATAGDEALEAMMALGFSLNDAIQALETVPKDIPTAQRVTLALRAGGQQDGDHGAHAVVVVALRRQLLRAQLVRLHDLARERQRHAPVGPTPGSSAQGAQRGTRKEFVGAQAAHGVAGQQEDEVALHASHARGARGPHGDTVKVEAAEFGHQPRCVILETHGTATGNQHDIGSVIRHGFPDPLGLVGQDLERKKFGAIPGHQGTEHDRVAEGPWICYPR